MVEINFKKMNDMVPVIVQDYTTGVVLMMAYMNPLAYQKTIETGKMHYWSRSRNKLWFKGEESGNVQILKELYVDCDEDTILVKVDQIGGAACHEGFQSCFFRKWDGKDYIEQGFRIFDPKKVYGKK